MSTNPTTDKPEELTDASRYMRTFAKDMAQAQGKPAPVSTPKPVAPQTEEPKTETSDGVTLPQVDESLITQSGLRRDGEETLDLNDSPTEGSVSVFEQKEPVPAPAPTPTPPSQMSMTGSSATPSRDSILARLKERAGSRADVPVATPAPRPEFVAPAPEVPRMPPVARDPRPTPPPAPKAPEPEKAERFHSYSTDFSGRIDTKGASAFSILAAQSDNKPREVVRTRSVEKSGIKPMTVLAIVFSLLTVGVVGATAYFGLTRTPDVLVTEGVPSLISADETKELEGVSGGDFMRTLSDTANEPLVTGNVLVTYIASASSTPKGLPFNIPQPGGTLIKALPLFAPDILVRNVRPESTVGIVHAGEETRPFFIFRVASFERTFAGMLAWEANMQGALDTLYPPYPITVIETLPQATTTAPSFVPTGFVDAVVRNYDVRILRDVNGKSIMLYGYKDKETLILARDEAAFIELVGRLNASGK